MAAVEVGKKRFDSAFILKEETIGVSEGLGMGCERPGIIPDDSKGCGVE